MTTTTPVSVCPRCGTIEKSGKMSCCGRDGSWFNNCGGAGNTRLQHTWYEGIQACKTWTRSGTSIGQRENTAQEKGTQSSHGGDKVNSKGIMTAAKPFMFSSFNISISAPDTTPVIASPAHTISTKNSKVISVCVITFIIQTII